MSRACLASVLAFAACAAPKANDARPPSNATVSPESAGPTSGEAPDAADVEAPSASPGEPPEWVKKPFDGLPPAPTGVDVEVKLEIVTRTYGNEKSTPVVFRIPELHRELEVFDDRVSRPVCHDQRDDRKTRSSFLARVRTERSCCASIKTVTISCSTSMAPATFRRRSRGRGTWCCRKAAGRAFPSSCPPRWDRQRHLPQGRDFLSTGRPFPPTNEHDQDFLHRFHAFGARGRLRLERRRQQWLRRIRWDRRPAAGHGRGLQDARRVLSQRHAGYWK